MDRRRPPQVHLSKHQCYRTMYDYLSVATSKKPVSELDSAAWTSPAHPPLSELPLPPEHLQRAWSARGVGARRRSETSSNSTMRVQITVTEMLCKRFSSPRGLKLKGPVQVQCHECAMPTSVIHNAFPFKV